MKIWAERYDRKLDDIFDVQDEITHKIVVELHINLIAGESSRPVATGTNSVKAWELVMRAYPLMESLVHDDSMLAKKLAEQALELDSNYAGAWNVLGWIYWQESVFNWSSETEKSMQMAQDTAQKAISVDAHFPEGYALLGYVHLVRGDIKQAIAMCEKSVRLAPSDSLMLALLAEVLIEAGKLKEGIQKIQKALRLCPFPPFWYLGDLGLGFHLSGNNEAAVFALDLAVEREPGSHFARVWLASTLAEMASLDEASAISKAVLDIEPGFSVLRWLKSYKSITHTRLRDNLLAAGLPE